MSRARKQQIRAQETRSASRGTMFLRGLGALVVGFSTMLLARWGATQLRAGWGDIVFTPLPAAALIPLPDLPPIPDGSYDLEQDQLDPVLMDAFAKRMYMLVTHHPDPAISQDLFQALNERRVGFWYRHAADRPNSPAAFGMMDASALGSAHRLTGESLLVIRIDSFSLTYGTEWDIRNVFMALPHEKAHWDSCAALPKAEQQRLFGFDAKPAPCEFLWAEELKAYELGCRSILKYGLVNIELHPYCQAVDEPAAFARELFRHQARAQVGSAESRCLPTWAKLAGHPFWWAYYWP